MSFVTLKPGHLVILFVILHADAALIVVLKGLGTVHSSTQVGNDLASLTSRASFLASLSQPIEIELISDAAADAAHDHVHEDEHQTEEQAQDHENQPASSVWVVLAVVVVRKVERQAIDDPDNLDEAHNEEVADPEGWDVPGALAQHPDDVEVHARLEDDQGEDDLEVDQDGDAAPILGLPPPLADSNQDAEENQDYEEHDEEHLGDSRESFFLRIVVGEILADLVAMIRTHSLLSLRSQATVF